LRSEKEKDGSVSQVLLRKAAMREYSSPLKEYLKSVVCGLQEVAIEQVCAGR